MADEINKENIADGLLQSFSVMNTETSPRKAAKKSRSLSMGPDTLDVPLKEESGNRRKSAFVPAVKSILSGNKQATKEAEEKRKAARRKSLANRRVSFAPEATLHTWDVVEFVQDATTSSSSSDSTKCASSASQASSTKSHSQVPSSDAEDQPSTPLERPDRSPTPELSPANQRDLHQKKRRRSSGIPPMNFNNPEDFSSSPAGGSSPVEEDGSGSEGSEDSSLDAEGEDVTARSIASGDSGDSGDSTSSSSARLDAALRQASIQAGTQGIDFDENGDMTMEMANDEITNAFQSWVGKNRRDTAVVRKVTTFDDQENVNPFHTDAGADAISQPSKPKGADIDDETQDMSMDMTHALGGIVGQAGKIPAKAEPSTEKAGEEPRSLKRRRSSTNVNSAGSPQKRPNTRRSMSRRRDSADDSTLGDETMDLTLAVGGIQKSSLKAVQQDQLEETSLGEETMDFTMAVGVIKPTVVNPKLRAVDKMEADGMEDMSMELTESLGRSLAPPTDSPKRTPVKGTRSPRKSIMPSPKTPEPAERTPRKSPRKSGLHTVLVHEKNASTPHKSPRKSPRKSMAPGSLSPAKLDGTSAEDQSSAGKRPKMHNDSPPATVGEALAAILQKEAPSKTNSLADSLKLLSTPRKQPSQSQGKMGLLTGTPKVQATPKKAMTPKKASTPKNPATPQRPSSHRKRVKLDVAASPEKQDASMAEESDQSVEPISLQEFLNMTNIRFMDLTTTKRRATGHPGADGMLITEVSDQEEEGEASLENNIAAAVGIVPMLSMYQHSCQEMKSYISTGRTEVKALESAAYELQPPLFHEYASAPAAEKSIMDTQFKNMKSNARMQSKSGWHAWRTQLLDDLKKGLMATSAELDQDEMVLQKLEHILGKTMPVLKNREEELKQEVMTLEERRRDAKEGVGGELEEARETLNAVEQEVLEKNAMLDDLQAQLIEKTNQIDTAMGWKTEIIAEIKEAERVREEFRGWNANEVSALNENLRALETQCGWTFSGVAGSNLTISHRDELLLSFYPQAFISSSNSPASNAPNAPISLSYIGAEDINSSSPRSTVKRFFLQLLRAHALAIPQCRTRVFAFLNLIQSGWSLAQRVEMAVRALEASNITDVYIQGDECLAIETNLLLPSLITKVRLRFTLDLSVNIEDGAHAKVNVTAKAVYGEKYDEPKMGEFISQFVRGRVGSLEEARQWAVGVEDLRGRLIRRGAKGVRVDS